MTITTHRSDHRTRHHADDRTPVMWGVVFGLAQAAAPVAIWWLTPAAVQSILLVLIAAVYIGFAVADDEAKSLGGVEPLHAAMNHVLRPFFFCHSP